MGGGILGGMNIYARTLSTIGLDGRATLALNARGAGQALLVECRPSEMLDAWSRARAVVPTTGAWPVLLAAWGSGGTWADAFSESDPFSDFYFHEQVPPAKAGPADLIASASRLDLEVWRTTAESDAAYWRDHLADLVSYQRDVTLKLIGSAPETDELMTVARTAGAPRTALERFLFDWEDSIGATTPDLRYQDWFHPSGIPVALAFLPTSRPWEVFAYVHSLYGVDHIPVIAAARAWHDSFGAEPVALWGTMVQFLVARRPADRESCWRTAVIHGLLGPDTLAGPGVTVREHARALRVLDRWFLHARP
jgi:uncharacterized protein DUF4253